MSYPNQGWPEPNAPRSEQPTQQASLPQYGPPGQGPPGQPPSYGSQQPYAAPPVSAPQPYGAPQSYGAPQQYGAPQSYGAAPQYGAPQPYGAAPQYGAPQPYGAAPPHGAAPQYGAPQPYGASVGPAPGRRPGIVTTAAVLAFVNAGIVIITKLLAFAILATFTSNAIADWGMGLVVANYVVLLSKLVAGGLLIWGGVAALQGRSRRILVIATVTQATLSVLGVVVSLASSGGRGSGGGSWYVGTFLELVFTAIILTLILQPSSTEFFRARKTTQ
jgi:hypothetical protein